MLVGIIAAVQFIWPDFFILKFNIIRTLHINALVVWLLSGLMGATYYVVPEESETELWSWPLAQFQFWATVVTITLVVLGYIWMGLDPQANKTDIRHPHFERGPGIHRGPALGRRPDRHLGAHRSCSTCS